MRWIADMLPMLRMQLALLLPVLLPAACWGSTPLQLPQVQLFPVGEVPGERPGESPSNATERDGRARPRLACERRK